MSDTTATPETTDTELTPNDRRALLRKLAIGGAGAAAGAVMLSNGRVSAGTEGAPGTDNTLELGAAETNTSVTPTTLVHDPAAARTAGASSLSVAGAVPAADAPFPAQVGGYGNAEVANGVHGSTTAAAGFGVVAANLAAAAAAPADPVPTGLAVASLGGAQVRFVPLPGAVTGPTPGKHVAGELYVDKDGTLWFTVPAPTTADATAVRFVKLAGTPTTGSFHAISPQRAYDSRQAAYAVSGVMAPNTNRVISVADGHGENGAVTLANAVPAGATAVQINLTAANMTAPNFLQVAAGNVTTVTASVLNWGPGDIQIANAVTVPLDASRQIKVFCGNQTGSTHVIVDVFGYYL
jgi:hypothetical protein